MAATTEAEKPVTVHCPICKKVIEIPQYDKLTRSDALVKHLSEEHMDYIPKHPGGNPMTREEISQIATSTADEVMERMREQMEVRDIVIGCAIGEGAIPLYGRETRKEPCAGCRIDSTKPLEAGNVMATTKDAIGTLSRDEVRDWCSEIIEVTDGRCSRARAIRTAAKECKEKHPEDTAKFFECYAPAFSKITKGSNPGNPNSGKLAALREILSTKTVEEAIAARAKYIHLALTPDELEVIDRHFNKLKSGTPYQEEGERIARQLGNGVIYTGPQMHHDKLSAHLFTDAAVTGTTFACLGLEECKAKLIQKRKDFGAAPPTFS